MDYELEYWENREARYQWDVLWENQEICSVSCKWHKWVHELSEMRFSYGLPSALSCWIAWSKLHTCACYTKNLCQKIDSQTNRLTNRPTEPTLKFREDDPFSATKNPSLCGKIGLKIIWKSMRRELGVSYFYSGTWLVNETHSIFCGVTC